MSDEIPQWTIEEAVKRLNEALKRDKIAPHWSIRDAAHPTMQVVARLIAKYENPPVDPDLEKAREICARVAVAARQRYYSENYCDGIYDNEPEVQFALSALKEARNA